MTKAKHISYSIVQNSSIVVLGWKCPFWLTGMRLEENPLQGVKIASALIVVFSMIRTSILVLPQQRKLSRSFLRAIFSQFFGTIAFHIAAVLFGCPLTDLVEHTFYWSVFMASISIMPIGILAGSSAAEWKRFILDYQFHSNTEVVIVLPAVGAALGGYLGALPIPLDWDRPWQQWPLTCLYGGMMGHFMGSVVAVVYSALLRNDKSKET